MRRTASSATLGVSLFDAPLDLERTLYADDDVLTVEETVTNTGVEPAAVIWVHILASVATCSPVPAS